MEEAHKNYGHIGSFVGCVAESGRQTFLISLNWGGISNSFFLGGKGISVLADNVVGGINAAENIYVAAGWAKAVWYLWEIGTRNVVLIPHSHEYGKCKAIGMIRCDELPEDELDELHIGLVPVNINGWPVLSS